MKPLILLTIKYFLTERVGLSGTVFSCSHYIAKADAVVATGNHKSERIPMTCGVLQGSILGTLLFNTYMLPLGQIIHENDIAYHSHTDDFNNVTVVP